MAWKKNWEMLGVDLVAAGDATEIYIWDQKPSKSAQIDDVFVFEERLTMRNASLFKSTKKQDSAILWQQEFVEIEGSSNYYRNNSLLSNWTKPISWWICSSSEIPLWTFPIEPFSPPRQTCFDFTRAPGAGGINMFHMLRWICSKLKVEQLPQQVV